MILLKKTFLLSLFLWIALSANAQGSYIYIELIKTIPCKIIQNGKEVPLLNKNFALLTISENREQNIDIEFGAALYPKQSFVIESVADAAYAYKLAKSGEQSFYLLDLVNNGKIIESNSAINIGLATESNTINFGKNQKVNYNAQSQKKGTLGWLKKRINGDDGSASVRKERPVSPTRVTKNTQQKPLERQEIVKKNTENSEPQYGVVEVINAKNPKTENLKTREESGTTLKKNIVKPGSSAATRRSCYLTASDREVESFIEKLGSKSDDEAKLLILRKKQFTGCLSVNQVLRMADDFSTQYGKYNVVRISFSNLENPQDIMQLESLFKTEGYKSKFYKLVNPQQ